MQRGIAGISQTAAKGIHDCSRELGNIMQLPKHKQMHKMHRVSRWTMCALYWMHTSIEHC